MIIIPQTPDEASGSVGEFRAGGTDLSERRRSGIARGSIVDLRDLEDLDRIEWNAGAAHIGARIRIATVARDQAVHGAYPGLAAAAAALATPQIRAVGTLGGNLLQRNRCWYYRHPATTCFKKGGDSCPARDGDHLYGVCFDRGPCVAPHPSTLGMALLAYDATVDIHAQPSRTISELYGDGADPTRDHLLEPGQLLTGITVPPPVTGERAAYRRAIGRARAEWPLVEAVVRLVADETITFARVAIGGVAPVPLRLPAVEEALVGLPGTDRTFHQAAELATTEANPLPMTRYKVNLTHATVLDTLQRALRETTDTPR
ncbi:FAD binding domain-containing protein [Actinophytocola sp.]|uniref:FAD binding domain-containing protein n=1 Tax=Actinophytocola sp. TaxID=1872138 RepID=UPI003D6C3E6A